MTGRLVATDPDAGTLTWATANAPEPLVFSLSSVHEVTATAAAEPLPQGTVQLRLDQGEVWAGRPIRLDRETLELDSRAAGRITLPTSRVREIHVAEQALPFRIEGPDALAEWNSVPGPRAFWTPMGETLVTSGATAVWREIPGLRDGGLRMAFRTSGSGHLTLMAEFYGDRATASIPSPERAPIVHPRTPPWNHPGVDTRSTYAVYINAQTVFLVRFRNGREQRLGMFERPVEERFDAEVEILVDPVRAEFLVRVDGREAIRHREPRGFEPGGDTVALVGFNMRPDEGFMTTVRDLVVERRAGPIPEAEPRLGRVLQNEALDVVSFSNDDVLSGTLVSIVGDTVHMEGTWGEQKAPLGRVRSLTLAARGANAPLPPPSAVVELNTRERIVLDAVKLTPEWIEGRSPTGGPVRLARAALRRLEFGTESAPPGPDSMTFTDGNRLTGRLAGIDSSASVLTWSSPAAPELLRFPLENVNQVQVGARTPASPDEGFLVGMANGDRWAGRIVSWGSEHLTLETPAAGRVALPSEQVRRLDREEGLRLERPLSWDFRAAPIIVGRSIIAQGEATPDGLRLSGNVIARSPLAVPEGSGVRISFEGEWPAWPALEMTMFADGERDSATGHVISVDGNGVSVSRRDAEQIEAPPRRRVFGAEVTLRAGGPTLAQVAREGMPGRFHIEVIVQPETSELGVWIDGKEEIRIRDPEGMARRGGFLTFLNPDNVPLTAITGLEVRPFRGPLPPAEPAEAAAGAGRESRVQFTNGDVIRGDLQLRDGQPPSVRSAATEFGLPLDRVQSVVLGQIRQGATAPDEPGVQVSLRDGSEFRLTQVAVDGTVLEGTYLRMGPVRIPRDAVQTLEFRSAGP